MIRSSFVQDPSHSSGQFTYKGATALAIMKKRARQTVSTIEAALESNQTTAIAEIIQIIQTLAARAFKISVPELSQLIGRDPTITHRVISAANTLGYNPFGTPILTISQAIHTIGFEKVRNLAISLMLTQNAGLAKNTYEQREMAALSVCSGMLSQILASEKEGGIEDELAFVCSSLRNYGKLLMATFMVDDFRVARSLIQRTGDESAYLEVFGLTPIALGLEILEKTNLPKGILSSLRAINSDLIQRAPQTTTDEALVLAELSGRLCEVVFNDRIGPEAFNGALMDVIARFQRSFPVGLEAVNIALQNVEMQLTHLNRVIGISEEFSPGTLKLRARINGELVPEPPPAALLKLRGIPSDPIAGPTREEAAEDSFQHAMEEIEEQLASGDRIDLRPIYSAVVQAIKDSLQLDSCLLFLPEDMEPEKMSARFGVGPLYERVKNRPIVSPRNKDIFAICLSRKEDILIQDCNAGKIRSVIPDWIHVPVETNSFIVLPVLSGQRLFAILLGCVTGDQIVAPSENDLRRIRALRGEMTKLRRRLDTKELISI